MPVEAPVEDGATIAETVPEVAVVEEDGEVQNRLILRVVVEEGGREETKNKRSYC
jgi:hypothetical protein